MDKNLVQRALTGILFVAAVVFMIVWSYWTLGLLFLLIAVLGLREFYQLAEKTGAHPQKAFAVLFGAWVIVSAYFSRNIFHGGNHQMIYYSWLILFFMPFFIELFRAKENPFMSLGWTYLGLIYILLPLTLFSLLFVPLNTASGWSSSINGLQVRHSMYDYKPVLLFFILIWVNDTMAYVTGRLLGRHKLFERISPKKTWEGFFGGFIFTALAAFFITNWFMSSSCHYKKEFVWVGVAFILSITGMLGDLAESMFKRSVDIKDSGNILPGHGGILDRFDALLLAAPFVVAGYHLLQKFIPFSWCQFNG